MRDRGVYGRPARSMKPSAPLRKGLLAGKKAEEGRCQVGSATDSPCARPATVEILRVPFCEQCVREQEAYFALGEGTREPRGVATGRTYVRQNSRVVSPAAPAGPSRRPRRTATGRALGLLMAATALVLASAACDESQQPPGDPADAQQRTMVRPPTLEEREKDAGFDGAVARAGDAEARVGAAARADDAVANARDAVVGGHGAAEGGNDGDGGAPSEVTLKVAGDPGTAFSGACSVGGREHDMAGRVPERYAYELDGGRLECEIRKEGGDTLEVAIIGEGVHSVQRSNAPGGSVRFSLSGGGLSSSTSSISLNQTVESSIRSFSGGSR